MMLIVPRLTNIAFWANVLRNIAPLLMIVIKLIIVIQLVNVQSAVQMTLVLLPVTPAKQTVYVY